MWCVVTETLSAWSIACRQMKADDKAATLEDFVEGRIKVLIATTIVEVGIDDREATVMVVENAQQFGLAQLHQVRATCSVVQCDTIRSDGEPAQLNTHNDHYPAKPLSKRVSSAHSSRAQKAHTYTHAREAGQHIYTPGIFYNFNNFNIAAWASHSGSQACSPTGFSPPVSVPRMPALNTRRGAAD